ncbi:DUF1361 domain-containing protein [uncultured Croceitalea sp.]|uniref:DUF1361 domain-containing protein n=1 Tax=uncultured Croceitalea sp. TaxID=1798908 RepID=UPI00330682EB
MKFKDLLFEKYIELRNISIGIFVTTLLLTIRIKLTQDPLFIFLGWNLILALIPFGITLFIYKNPSILSRWYSRIGFTLIWLLFLPNAPYIVTDFIHLQLSKPNLLILDFILIGSCAITGVLSGLYSFKIMIELLSLFYSKKFIHILSITISLLCGFGVYLGRVVRLNSWDIFTRPWHTCILILDSITEPLAWIITVSFGCLFILNKRRKMD